MKTELESLKGYSIKKLFKKLDRQGRGFIDVTSVREFITKNDPNFDESQSSKKKTISVKKALAGLMRRVLTSSDGRIVFTEFAHLMKPVDLRPYLKRIRKYTKEEKRQVERVQLDGLVRKVKEKRTGLRKPLTAFVSSEIMLNRDPERHVGLMAAKYGTSNELNLISESTGRQSFIDKESTLLRKP